MDGTTYSPTSIILHLSRIVNQLGGSADRQLHPPHTRRKCDPLSKARATLVETPRDISGAIIGIMLNEDEEEGKRGRK